MTFPAIDRTALRLRLQASRAGMRDVRLLPLVLCCIALGCSNANVQHNSLVLPLERRVPNDTRSATFGAMVASGAGTPSDLRSRPEILTPADPSGLPPMPVDADGCFVGLALSGGGSRSANFSAACMLQLQRVGMLQKVDYISTVSGGSLTGAFYCAARDDEWTPLNVQRRLTHSFASDLIAQTLLPWNAVALLFSDYDRTDILADSFRAHLFSRAGKTLTYADLRPDRPRLLMNATDLQSGRRFVFCNESFDEINSDLSKYPLSYAVAASSAVPIALHPVTLRDYSTSFAQYRHLIDGGVTDNLGVETLVETYAAQIGRAKAAGAPDPYPRGAIIIVLDAHTQFDAELSDKSDVGVVESLKTAAGLTSTALLNRASSATLADLIVRSAPDEATAKDLRGQIDALNTSGYLTLTDRTGHTVRVVYLSLEQLASLPDVPFQSFRESVNNIATYFNITDVEAYHLYQAADLLVRERFETRLRELVKGLERPMNAPAPTTAPDNTRPGDR